MVILGGLGARWEPASIRGVLGCPRDERCRPLGCGLADTFENVFVRVCGDRDARVAEQFAHECDVRAGGQQQRGAAVPQVVQADLADTGGGAQLGEALGHLVMRERVAIGPAEDQPVVVVRAISLVALGVLP